MQRSDPLVAIFTGHSGGHLFPAVAFAEKLMERYPGARIDLLTSRKAEKIIQNWTTDAIEQVIYLPDFPYPGKKPVKLLAMGINLAKAFTKSFNYMNRVKPDVCVGFGSYIAYPGILAARWRKVPTVLHEQNFTGGKANERLIDFVDEVAVSFKPTWRNRKLKSRQWVGLPLRSQLTTTALGSPDPDGRLRVLVLGGSQGARRINQVVLKAFEHLTSEEKQKIVVNHITGQHDFEWASAAYQDLNITAHVFPFHHMMNELYRESDLAVTRGGANTLFECAFFKLPAIVIPYPFADGHQKDNATYFDSRGGILAEDEQTYQPEHLIRDLKYFLNNRDELQIYSKNMAELASPDAADKLVDVASRYLPEAAHANH